MKYLHLLLLLVLTNQLLAIDPTVVYSLTPAYFNAEYHEIKVETKDLCHLNTWVIEPKGDSYQGATVLIAGSDSGNMGDQALLASQLAEKGYRVITFDYRGFGDSTDFQFNKMNLYHDEYVTDFIDMVEWSKKEYPNEQLGVLAFSMGSIVSTLGLEDAPVDFLIYESAVISPQKAKNGTEKFKAQNIILPKSVEGYQNKLNSVTTPLLMFSGVYDPLTALKEHKEYLAKEHVQSYKYQGDHLEGPMVLGITDYVNQMDAFIQEQTPQYLIEEK